MAAAAADRIGDIEQRLERLEAKVDALGPDLEAEIRSSEEDTQRLMRAGDEETRRQMRVLHEEVIGRIATLGDSLSPDGTPRPAVVAGPSAVGA